MISSCHSKQKIFGKQHDKQLTQNIQSSNKIKKLVLDQRTTPHMPNVSRCRHRQTSNTRNNCKKQTNKTTEKANVTNNLDLR